MRRVGGTAAVALGIVYLGIGAVFLLLPENQSGGGVTALLTSLVEDGAGMYLTLQWLFVLAGLLGLAVVGGLASVFGAKREGGVRWASAFGYLGFAVMVVNYLVPIAFVYNDRHRDFVEAGAQEQAIIASEFMAAGVAPQGWASFGMVGLWLVVIAALALADGALPRIAAAFGIGGGIANWLVPIGAATDTEPLITLAAILAIVVAPVFFIWTGLVMRREAPAGAG